MLPLALDFTGLDVVVVGCGRIGAAKASQLIEAGARVHLISEELLVAAPAGLASLQVRPYRKGDLAGAYLVISATANDEVNDLIVAEAAQRHIWLNVVDDPPRCNFYFTSVYRDGDVMVSVSTSGASPSLAQWIRRYIESVVPVGLGSAAKRLRAERDAMHAQGLSTEIDWRERVQKVVDEESQISSSWSTD